jgi:IBR domain, a half RING-finger domain
MAYATRVSSRAGLDEATAEFIFQLQLEEIESATSPRGEEGDAAYALQVYQEEVEALLTYGLEESVGLGLGKSNVCEACREAGGLIEVTCGHYYCGECLEQLVKTAVKEEASFPPRCCKEPVSVQTLRRWLAGSVMHEYERKKIEYSSGDKVYCSRLTCSAFVPAEDRHGDEGTCPQCGRVTCTHCKLMWHGGDCPKDKALQKVLDTAEQKGWQRCYRCRQVVERAVGCNHIT